MRRLGWLLLLAVTAAGVLLLFVFPGRTLLTQNHDIAVAEQHISALDREDASLRQQARTLKDPGAIERMARERFGLTLPGQREYDITAPPTTAAPVAPPATRPARHQSFLRDLEIWR